MFHLQDKNNLNSIKEVKEQSKNVEVDLNKKLEKVLEKKGKYLEAKSLLEEKQSAIRKLDHFDNYYLKTSIIDELVPEKDSQREKLVSNITEINDDIKKNSILKEGFKHKKLENSDGLDKAIKKIKEKVEKLEKKYRKLDRKKLEETFKKRDEKYKKKIEEFSKKLEEKYKKIIEETNKKTDEKYDKLLGEGKYEKKDDEYTGPKLN